MGGKRLRFESWKVRNHTQNVSQHHFYCFLERKKRCIWILKSSCILRSPTHDSSWQRPRRKQNGAVKPRIINWTLVMVMFWENHATESFKAIRKKAYPFFHVRFNYTTDINLGDNKQYRKQNKKLQENLISVAQSIRQMRLQCGNDSPKYPFQPTCCHFL